jgi:MFS family permease
LKRIYRLLLKLITANFGIMCFGDIYFLVALYMTNYGIDDPETIGWILSAYFAASALSRPFVGWVVERFSFKPVLIVASVFCVASGAGVALSGSSVPLILFFRAVAGLSSSLFLVAITTYQTLAVPEEVRGSSFTLVTAGTIAPLVTVVPLAEWLLRAGKPGLYIWLPVLPAFLCLFASMSLRPSDGVVTKSRDWGSYREVFTHPALRILFPSVICFAMTDAAIVSFAGLALEKKLVASAFISTQAFTAVLIRVFGFRLMDIMPRSRLAALSFLVTGGSLFAATFMESNMGFMAMGIVYGVAMGYGFPLHLSLIGDAVSERLRPKATAMVWFLMSVCFFLSPVITGYLARRFTFAVAYRIIMSCIIIVTPLIHRRFTKSFKSAG